MKKQRKKSLILLLMFISVLLFTFTVPVNALSIKETGSSDQLVCITENEKINDQNVLLDRALKGINDAPRELVKSIEENVKLSINGVVQSEKPLFTTELLKTYSNGKQTQNIYATTVISNLKEENDTLKALSRADLMREKEENGRSIDGTKKLAGGGEVILYTIMYYATGVNEPFVYLKSATAKTSILSSSFKVKSTKVRCGYKGVKFGGGSHVNYTSAWKSDVWNPSVSVRRVDLEATPAILWHIWGESKSTFSRGKQSWTLTHKLAEGTDTLPGL